LTDISAGGARFNEKASEFFPVLYREAAPNEIGMLAGGTEFSGAHEAHWASRPELAIAQKELGNEGGVFVEMSSNVVGGYPNITKPGWQSMWDRGAAEWVGFANRKGYADGLQAMTFSPAVLEGKWRGAALRARNDLRQRGFVETQNADGSITLRKGSH
jgi:hypothetical protein